MDAIVVRALSKEFKKTHRKHVTTLKSELVNLVLRRKRPPMPGDRITALRNIDLTIPKGKTVGLVGRNGSGKSTLLKLVTGIYAPTSGAVQVSGRISALLDLGAGFHPDFTGRENILINGIILGMTRAEVKARMDDIIAFAELGDFIDEPVRTYSSGMFMRLAFAVATHVDPEILIIDEILAVGDEHFSRKSSAKISEFKAAGKTILLVTHDLGALERWCDLAAWIDGGVIRMFGPPKEIVAAYRSAIADAEQNHAEVLQVPGAALPVARVGRRGLGLTVSSPAGAVIDKVKPSEPLVVRLSVAAPEPGDPVRIQLVRADGFELTSLTVPENTAAVLAQGGQVVLRLDRLGVAAGDYVLRARVGPDHDQERVEQPVQVEAISAEGLLHLEGQWDVEGGAQAGRSHG